MFHETFKGGHPTFNEKGERKKRFWWISNTGNVVCTNNWNEEVTTPSVSLTSRNKSDTGYYALSQNYFCEKYVHRLVARFFIPNPFNKKYVNHKDGNPLNNHWRNLEWVTARENQLHRYGHKDYIETPC